MKDFYNGSRCHDLDTFYRSIEKIGIVPHAKRLMIGGPRGVKRFCVDVIFGIFKRTMVELYKGIDIQMWVHVENLDEFVKNIKTYRDGYGFSD